MLISNMALTNRLINSGLRAGSALESVGRSPPSISELVTVTIGTTILK